MPDKPAWRSLFDRAERVIGRPVEAVVASDAFADALATVAKVQHYSRGRFDAVTERGLRMLNLPAATEVDRLSRQLGALQRDLRRLSAQDDEAPGRAAHRKAGPPPEAGEDGHD